MTTEEAQKLAVPAGVVLGALVAAIVAPGVQGVRERFAARRNAASAIHTARAEALLKAIGHIYALESSAAQAAIFASEATMMNQNAERVRTEAVANMGKSRLSEAQGQQVIDTMVTRMTEMREATERKMEAMSGKIFDSHQASRDLMLAVVEYGPYPAWLAYDERTLVDDLHDLIAARPESVSGASWGMWRFLLVLVAKELGRLAYWEREAAINAKGFRKPPKPLVLADFARLGELIKLIGEA